jgi:hypothetical protein
LKAIDTDARTGGQRFIRRVNNSTYDVLVKLKVEDGEFWCECSDPGCDHRILLTLREYKALRLRSDLLLSRKHAEEAVQT